MYTIEQYNKLKALKASGASQISYSDKNITVRSLDDLNKILNEMEKELGLINKKKGRSMRTTFNKGITG